MDASRVNQRRTRRVGPLRGDPVQFGADLYKEIAGPWAGNFLTLLGPVEAGQETLGIIRRQLGDGLTAGLDWFGEGRRQRIPIRAQHLQAILVALVFHRIVGRWFHVATL